MNRKLLVTIGWLLVITVIVLSLININATMPDIKNGDKVGHFVAYFSIMTWFTWLYPKPWVRNLYAIGFIVLGGVMEVLQSMTAHRLGDIQDFHMNTIGVIVGLVFAVFTSQVPFVKKIFKF